MLLIWVILRLEMYALLGFLPKQLYIFVVLLPLWVGVLLTAWLWRKGLAKAERYAWYWLVSGILLSLIFIQSCFDAEMSLVDLASIAGLAIAYFQTFSIVWKKSKGNKRA